MAKKKRPEQEVALENINKIRETAKAQEQRKSAAAPASQPYRMNVTPEMRGPSGVTYEDELKAERDRLSKEQMIKSEQQKITSGKIAEQPSEELIPEIDEIQRGLKSKKREKYEAAGAEILAKADKSKLNKVFSRENVIGFEKTKYALGELSVKQISAEAYDSLHTAITRKKPLKYVNAKETLDANLGIIQKNIDDVKLGAPYVNAKVDFENAVIALNRLQASTTGLGKDNLVWWVDDGMSIQAEILLQQEILIDLREDLNLAHEQQRIRSLTG